MISGVAAFMMNIANDIPSGYAPQRRIIMVITPMPIPYIIIPLCVMGDVEENGEGGVCDSTSPDHLTLL